MTLEQRARTAMTTDTRSEGMLSEEELEEFAAHLSEFPNLPISFEHRWSSDQTGERWTSKAEFTDRAGNVVVDLLGEGDWVVEQMEAFAAAMSALPRLLAHIAALTARLADATEALGKEIERVKGSRDYALYDDEDRQAVTDMSATLANLKQSLGAMDQEAAEKGEVKRRAKLPCAHDWEWRVSGSVCKICGVEQREAFKANGPPSNHPTPLKATEE